MSRLACQGALLADAGTVDAFVDFVGKDSRQNLKLFNGLVDQDRGIGDHGWAPRRDCIFIQYTPRERSGQASAHGSGSADFGDSGRYELNNLRHLLARLLLAYWY
ncbi:MAG TPA: hypothetical protein VMI92_04275 [Steroidobacteraceae bacterium]|nr:hypothetical protein [Steroidobacteraceae bacterium]